MCYSSATGRNGRRAERNTRGPSFPPLLGNWLSPIPYSCTSPSPSTSPLYFYFELRYSIFLIQGDIRYSLFNYAPTPCIPLSSSSRMETPGRHDLSITHP